MFRWAHPANIFLAFLVLISLVNVWLLVSFSHASYIQPNTVQTARVLSLENAIFGGFQGYIWYNSSVWKITTGTLLPTGYQIQFLGTPTTFDFSKNTQSFDQYEKTLGIMGEINNFKLLAKQKNCDIWCGIINRTEIIERSIKNTYKKAGCSDYKFVVNIIASNVNCSDVAALSIGLVTGGTKDFSKDTKTAFQTLGLTHLVAVSGFQVILVLTVIEAFFIQLRAPRWVRFGLALLSVICLILLVGPQPPVIRSSISVLLSQLVLIFLGRKVYGLRLLMYSGIIMLAINPFYLLSGSFQLSFLASLGLIASSGNEIHPLPFVSRKFIQETLLTTVFTFLYTLPIIINFFGKISLLSIFSNILLLPIIPFITFGNLFGLIPVIGDIFLIPILAIQAFILQLIYVTANSPFFQLFNVKLGSFSVIEIIFYYLFLAFSPILFKKMAHSLTFSLAKYNKKQA